MENSWNVQVLEVNSNLYTHTHTQNPRKKFILITTFPFVSHYSRWQDCLPERIEITYAGVSSDIINLPQHCEVWH